MFQIMAIVMILLIFLLGFVQEGAPFETGTIEHDRSLSSQHPLKTSHQDAKEVNHAKRFDVEQDLQGDPVPLRKSTSVHGVQNFRQPKLVATDTLSETPTLSAFEIHFETTISLMPTDTSLKSLLAPLRETGEKHLQDLASRVRVYKTAFEAWENLHHILPERSTHSIFQRSRSGDQSRFSSQTAIRRYDDFRSYINHLGTLLFPGTKLFLWRPYEPTCHVPRR